MQKSVRSGTRGRRSHWVTALAILLITLLGAPTTEAEEDKRAKDNVTFTIPDVITMEEFLKSVSKLVDAQLLWHPGDKQVRTTAIHGPLRITGTHDEVLEQVRSLLIFYELVVIKISKDAAPLWVVVDARRSTSILRLHAEKVEITDASVRDLETQFGRYVTTTIVVPEIEDLRQMRTAVARMVTGQQIGNVSELPNSNALVVTDFAPSVASIYRMIREADRRAAEARKARARQLEIIKLRHAQAPLVAGQLSRLFLSVTTTVRNPRVPVPASGATRPRLAIEADERTNQILITGHSEDIPRVKEAIARLDVPVEADPKLTTVVIPLQYLSAERTALTLQRLMERSRAPSAASKVLIEPDDQTDALIVVAAPEDLGAIQRLVEQLEKRAKAQSGDE